MLKSDLHGEGNDRMIYVENRAAENVHPSDAEGSYREFV